MRLYIVCAFLLLVFLSASSLIGEQSGPVARFGTTPTIDGIFGDGEWDDAEVVQVESSWRFRLYWSEERGYVIVSAGADRQFDQAYGPGSPEMVCQG